MHWQGLLSVEEQLQLVRSKCQYQQDRLREQRIRLRVQRARLNRRRVHRNHLITVVLVFRTMLNDGGGTELRLLESRYVSD